MPDILHWLGIKKIDRMLSMSNMKHDAIVDQGISILERVPIPDRTFNISNFHLFLTVTLKLTTALDMIPADSRVEIDAKINAGYFTTGKKYTDEELSQVQGRGWQTWEDVTH